MSYAALEAMGFLGPLERNPDGCGYQPPKWADGSWAGVHFSHCQRRHEGERAIGAHFMRFEHPDDGSCPCCPEEAADAAD